jgi:hypothetical protein
LLETRFRLVHVDGDTHEFKISVSHIREGIELLAQYESGSLGLPTGTTVARWPVTFSPPQGNDPGQIWIGDGRIDIQIPALRGLGLGSIFMYWLIGWIKERPNVPVVPIDLCIEDARTPEERDRRNRFYERLGLKFAFEGEHDWGVSLPIMSHDLLSPKPVVPRGWSREDF